ncbi:MAG: hypothetical protein NTX45_00215 [Proteobacteria bacterium]|nr:hypothetical protein [Pseudomonadota bacterium]
MNQKPQKRIDDPTRHLPMPMRRYLGLPNRLFVIWLLLSGLALGVYFWQASDYHGGGDEPPARVGIAHAPQATASDSGPPTTATPTRNPLAAAAQLAPTQTTGMVADITVSGAPSFTLKKNGNKVLISVPAGVPLELVDGGGGTHVQTQAGELLYRLKAKEDGQGKIYDATGQFRYRLKCESEDGEENCKVYDGLGKLLNRVKIKADSFNVYADGSDRLYKGKFKNGAYVLKTEAGSIAAGIQGANGLKEAALLALPVEIPLRLLFWWQGSH